MLVLSRRRDENIFIGDNVKITVLEICGDKVRLGIEAPKDIAVHRHEVFLKTQDEKKAKTVAGDLTPVPAKS